MTENGTQAGPECYETDQAARFLGMSRQTLLKNAAAHPDQLRRHKLPKPGGGFKVAWVIEDLQRFRDRKRGTEIPLPPRESKPPLLLTSGDQTEVLRMIADRLKPPKLFLSTKEAAAYSGLSVDRVRELCKEYPSLAMNVSKTGRRLKISRSRLDQFAANGEWCQKTQ